MHKTKTNNSHKSSGARAAESKSLYDRGRKIVEELKTEPAPAPPPTEKYQTWPDPQPDPTVLSTGELITRACSSAEERVYGKKGAARRAAARDRLQQIQHIRELLNLDEYQLEAIEAVLLIQKRVYVNIDDPISKFLADLLHRYMWAEDRGEGMTIKDVESELDDLRENMAEALSRAQFTATRYPLPAVATEEAPAVTPASTTR